MDKKENNSSDVNYGVTGGVLTLIGAGLFDLEGIFDDEQISGNRQIYLHSMRFGDVVDGSESELAGVFFEDPALHAGSCKYSLDEVDVEEGMMVLTIKTKSGEKLARLEGPSEGFGEAFVTNKKGHLHVHPSEHENLVKFQGDENIDFISFELDDHIVTAKQPFDGIHPENDNGKANQLVIDVKAGRHGSKECANFYKSSVEQDTKHMMHTLGGSVKPGELNFAFTGALYINNEKYDVCIGQGHYSSDNNWHLASEDLTSSSNHKTGDLGAFHISTDGSHTFKVKLKG